MQLDQSWLLAQGADAPFLRSIDKAFGDSPPEKIGVAVSGGGDSMALLHLAMRWAAQIDCRLEAVTVNHGLRAEAASEAEMVAQFCAASGIAHTTLNWAGWNGQGNLSAAGRDARYGLMADWATSRGIGGIMLGHTADDIAETFLMRLRRKAGVDGLAAMQSLFMRNGIQWARPLLQHKRADLRDYLRGHGLGWVNDPTNEDERYERPRMRKLMRALDPLGLDTEALSAVAVNMGMTRDALAHYTRLEADRLGVQQSGDIVLPLDAGLPEEIQRRLVSKAVQWVGGLDYPPRADALQLAEMMQADAGARTVSGCLLLRDKQAIRITREFNACKDETCPTDHLWDGRWQLDGPHAPDLKIRALGESLKDCPDWRDLGIPRASLMASPSIWRGDTLIAAPIAGYNREWGAQIVANFRSFLLSH